MHYNGDINFQSNSPNESSDRYQPVGVHRAIMMAHAPISNYVDMEVNHIDGNKRNNVYLPGDARNNLEWVTRSENIRHSFETGLNPGPTILYGEDTSNAKFSNAQARLVCETLANGGSIQDAYNALGLPESEQESVIKFIYGIKQGVHWRFISQEYDFPMSEKYDVHTETEVELICQSYCQAMNINQIIRHLSTFGYRLKRGFVYSIIHATPNRWRHITDKYGLPVPSSYSRYQ